MHRIWISPLNGIPVCTSLRAQSSLVYTFNHSSSKIFLSRSLTTYTQPSNSTQFHPSNRLFGRTCMITGGSSGIGFAIAERFLQEGISRVILVGRSYERLRSAAAQLERPALESASAIDSTDGSCNPAALEPGTLVDSSDRVSLLIGDVSEAASWTRELESAMKPVDILVNSAGVSTSNVLPRLDPDDISKVLRTNLEGSLLTSRALIRAAIRNRMKSRTGDDGLTLPPPSRCIINVSSLLALKGGTGAVPYAASKAGILGLTRSLTIEAAETLRNQVIRSNVIVPGYIETPMIAEFSQTENDKLKNRIPLKRFGRPQEIADAAVFLAQNEYANNCVINLDGGLSAL